MTGGFFLALVGAVALGQILSNGLSVVVLHLTTRLVLKRQLKRRTKDGVDIDGLLQAFQDQYGVEEDDSTHP